jgi:hypothetical protein
MRVCTCIQQTARAQYRWETGRSLQWWRLTRATGGHWYGGGVRGRKALYLRLTSMSISIDDAHTTPARPCSCASEVLTSIRPMTFALITSDLNDNIVLTQCMYEYSGDCRPMGCSMSV